MQCVAHVNGQVSYRLGDGPLAEIPVGKIEVETTHSDATIGWVDGEAHMSAALPIDEFRRYVARGAISLGAD